MRIFIGNFPFDFSEDELKDFLAPYGLQRLNMVRDRNGIPRGFAFADLEDGAAAVSTLDDQPVNGRGLRVCPAIDRGDWDS